LTYRVLFVEDECSWQTALKIHAGTWPKQQFTWSLVETAEEARSATQRQRFHFVSLDHNLRDRPGEYVRSGHGVALCEHLLRNYPLTDRAIYTGYGTILDANKSGQLDGTLYLQKPLTEESADPNVMGADQYVQWIRNRLEQTYHLWALRRAGSVLPAQMAERATTVAEEGAQESRFTRRTWYHVGMGPNSRTGQGSAN
jgi:DNA-binding NtrC family response regulator